MRVALAADPQTLSLGQWEKPVEERLGAWQRKTAAGKERKPA